MSSVPHGVVLKNLDPLRQYPFRSNCNKFTI